MRKDYLRRVKRLSKEFKQDVIETTLRIHAKDGKAYPMRVYKSVSRRWDKIYRYHVAYLLTYLAELGIFTVDLEPVEEYRERMQKYSGLYERGCRRKYFRPSDGIPNDPSAVEYKKVFHEELGLIDPDKDWEYPA
jgi:hypothetical protein